MKAILALVLVACGAHPAPRTEAQPATATVDASAPLPGLLPTYEALVERSVAEVPGMHEALRIERTTELVPKVDTCYRAIVGSEGDRVRAYFADATATRGDPGTTVVPPRGPVCARKGEALRLVLDGAARAIVWQSP